MPFSENDIAYCAARLHQAAISREPIHPLSDRFGDLDTDTAYAIQRRLLHLLDQPTTGYKLGFTSAAMRKQMGVPEPNYGKLLQSGQVTDATTAATYIHPLVEPEIALVLARPLSGPDATAETAAAATGSCHAAMEIVDSRYIDYKFKAADNISDNSSASGYVLGPGYSLAAAGDLSRIRAVLSKNGTYLDEGTGNAALGGPLQALAWLANLLAGQGTTIPAGAIILTGGLTRAHAATAADRFTVAMDHLGEVSLRFA